MLWITLKPDGKSHKAWLSDRETGEVISEMSLRLGHDGNVEVGIDAPDCVRIERDCVKKIREEKENAD